MANSFSIPAIRSFIPERLKPWVVVAIVIVFQLASGGVYLAAVSQMVGSLSLKQEDIMMVGYASMVGMALTFTIMFRLKFRFTAKTSLLSCATALIVANLVAMYSSSLPLLVLVSFFAGIFRMWATFECNSTIQLWVSPTRDMSVFFCFIYLLVHSSIQLSGLTTIYLSFLQKWEYMHWLMVGLLGLVILVTLIIYRNYRTMKKLPLYGIDWLGGLMWGLSALSILFVLNYGDFYDWFESDYIIGALCAAALLILLNLWRASFIRHPFIELKTWRHPVLIKTMALYLVINLFLAPSNLLEPIYMEAILGFDSLHLISLNWISLLGIVLGALFTYQTFALRKWRYKTMAVIGFSSILLYLLMAYFTMDFNQTKASLMLPLFFRSFGYVIIAISFITALTRIPFKQFFQAVTVQAFVSAGIGGAFGSALILRGFRFLTAKNSLLLEAGFDRVHREAMGLPQASLYGEIQLHSLMVSIKELYGWLIIIALACLLLFIIKESSLRPNAAVHHPKMRKIRRFIKRQLRVQSHLNG